MQTPYLPKGVVLDEPLLRALLFVAVQEKLVDGDPTIGDGFVRRLLERPPSELAIKQAFEQVLIGGNVLIPSWLPSKWQGDLFDSGILVPLRHLDDAELVEISEVHPEIVLHLCNKNGENWTIERLDKIRDRLEACSVEWDNCVSEWSKQHPQERPLTYDTVWLLDTIHASPQTIYNLTSEQWRVYQELHTAIQASRPIIEAIKEFRGILTHALNREALCSIQIPSDLRGQFPFTEVEDTANRQLMLQISCNELPHPPVYRTLRETLTQSNSDAGKAYRNKLSEWSRLCRQGGNGFEKVLSDIQQARSELEYSKSLARTGNLATVIGGGSLATSAVFPLASALVGGVATVVGVLALSGNTAITYRNRWAMFG